MIPLEYVGTSVVHEMVAVVLVVATTGTLRWGGMVRGIVKLPDWVESCWLTACTVSEVPLAGAVRWPCASIVPAVVDQTTNCEKLPVPSTFAAQFVVVLTTRLFAEQVTTMPVMVPVPGVTLMVPEPLWLTSCTEVAVMVAGVATGGGTTGAV